MTPTELKSFQHHFKNQAAAEALDNPNLYLLGLYGVDLAATIAANIATTDNSKFILKYKTDKLSPTSWTLFKDNSSMVPFSNTLLADQNNKNLLNATNLRVSTYGNPYLGTGKINVDGIFNLAPYVTTEYSSSSGKSKIIKKNNFYADSTFVQNNKNFISYQTINNTSGRDADAKATSRKASFLDASTTGEYILSRDVQSISTKMIGLGKYKVIKSINETGVSNAKFMKWNQYGYAKGRFNAMGRKLMWGKSEISKIDSSNDSLDTFYSGTGALLRESIAGAVNWMAMIKTVSPKKHKVFYPSVALPADYVTSGLSAEDAYPKYTDKLETMKEMYESNRGDRTTAWKSDKFRSSRKTLEKLASDCGATASNPAQIPIFRYQFHDTPVSQVIKGANEMILSTLNELTPKVRFINEVEPEDWTSFKGTALIHKTGVTLIGGFGPDYDGLGSILSQYLKPSSTGGVVGLFAYIFK